MSRKNGGFAHDVPAWERSARPSSRLGREGEKSRPLYLRKRPGLLPTLSRRFSQAGTLRRKRAQALLKEARLSQAGTMRAISDVSSSRRAPIVLSRDHGAGGREVRDFWQRLLQNESLRRRFPDDAAILAELQISEVLCRGCRSAIRQTIYPVWSRCRGRSGG